MCGSSRCASQTTLTSLEEQKPYFIAAKRTRTRSSTGHVRASALSRHSDAFSGAWKLLEDFQWLPPTPRQIHLHLCWIDLFGFFYFPLLQFDPTEHSRSSRSSLNPCCTVHISAYWIVTTSSHLVPFVKARAPHSKFTYENFAGRPAVLQIKLHSRLGYGLWLTPSDRRRTKSPQDVALRSCCCYSNLHKKNI